MIESLLETVLTPDVLLAVGAVVVVAIAAKLLVRLSVWAMKLLALVALLGAIGLLGYMFF